MAEDAERQQYVLREAADLIGISPDALRKRFHAGRLDGSIIGGIVWVDAATIEAERADILRRMRALDARPGHGVQQQAELDALRSEVSRLRAVVASMAAASRGSNDATVAAIHSSNAHLDAIRMYMVPDDVSMLDGG